jgi:hypothetical protein
MTALDRRLLALLAALFLLAWVPGAPGWLAVAEEDEEGAEGEEGTETEKPKKEPAEKDAKAKKKKAKKKADKKAEEKFDLEAWGQIKEVKGSDFFSLTYTKLNGKKASKLTSFIKVADGATFYQDKPLNVTDLKEGDAVWLLGRPIEQETGAGGGLLGVARQIQNVTAIASGEALRVNRNYRDPRDETVQWCEAVIEKAGQAISVTYQENSYKVTLGRLAGVLHREKVEAAPLKNNLYVEFAALKTPDRPETKNASDAKKETFAAKKVVLLERRLLPIYSLLLE